MGWKGKARHGVSLVYRVSGELGEIRFTNMAADEVRETLKLEHWGRPDDITVSKENTESQAEDRKEEAQSIANTLRAKYGLRPLVWNRRIGPRVVNDYDREIGVIRKTLKSLCPTLSVRKGRGTAYSWIDITGSGKFGDLTETEKEALKRFGLHGTGNVEHISQDDRRHYVEKAAKQFGAEIPSEVKRRYEERDRYREEMRKRHEEMKKEASPTNQKTEVEKASEFEQMKRSIATGVGSSPEKVEFVNRWLAYLVRELKGVKGREARAQLAQMCMAALAEEAELVPDREQAPGYIG